MFNNSLDEALVLVTFVMKTTTHHNTAIQSTWMNGVNVARSYVTHHPPFQ